MAVGFAHGMVSRATGTSRPSGQSGTYRPQSMDSDTLPRADTADLLKNLKFTNASRFYEQSERENRVIISNQKSKGERYLTTYCTEVRLPLSALPDGVYKTVCPLSEDGIMEINVKDGNITATYNYKTFLKTRTIEEIGIMIADEQKKKEELDIDKSKEKLIKLSDDEIDKLALAMAKNKTEMLKYDIPLTTFWKCDPDSEEKQNWVIMELKRLKYYPKDINNAFFHNTNYYRFNPDAIDGIAKLTLYKPGTSPVFEESYINKQGKETTIQRGLNGVTIWTRSIANSRLYPSASESYKNTDAYKNLQNLRFGGKTRRKKNKRKTRRMKK